MGALLCFCNCLLLVILLLLLLMLVSNWVIGVQIAKLLLYGKNIQRQRVCCSAVSSHGDVNGDADPSAAAADDNGNDGGDTSRLPDDDSTARLACSSAPRSAPMRNGFARNASIPPLSRYSR